MGENLLQVAKFKLNKLLLEVTILCPVSGSIAIVQTYPQGRSIRAYILSTIREIFSANARALQKRDALVKKLLFCKSEMIPHERSE